MAKAKEEHGQGWGGAWAGLGRGMDRAEEGNGQV